MMALMPTPGRRWRACGSRDDPNYEKPTDKNEDNVYELLVVASDPQLNVRTLWVTIKVTNQEEDGEVSFDQRQPAVGVAITAESG